MNQWHPCVLTLTFLTFSAAACSGGTPTETNGSATDTGTDTGTSETGTTTTTTTGASASATTTATGGTMSGSMSSTGMACVPGQSVACVCMDGTSGAQVCAPDGMSFEPCECAGSTSNSSTTNMTTDPTTSTTDMTTDPTTTGMTTDPTTGTTDMTTGMACDDPGPEPNEVDDDAVDVDDLMNGCDANPGPIMGLLDGDQDVDFFHFHVNDQNCGFGPNEIVVNASANVQVCVYIDCDQGNAMFMCDGMMSMSPGGLPGCCSDQQTAITFDCGQMTPENANIFVSLSGAEPNACVDYTADYEFNPGG